MSSVPFPSAESPSVDPVPRTLALAAGGVLGLGAIGVLAGAPPTFVAAIVAAPLVGAVHVVGLTVPGLLVAQAILGLGATPSDTARAIVGGLRDGTALLLATLPLVLFFGASLGEARTVVVLSYLAGAFALGATLVRAWRLLVLREPEQPWLAVGTYGAWATVAAGVAMASASDIVGTIGGAP